MLAGPRYVRIVADFQQQLEFFLEKGIVILELQAEKRVRLDERSAAGDDFGATVRNEIERGEFLEDTDWIGSAEHGDCAGEANIFRARRGCGQNDRWRRVEKFWPMMLADAEDVEADSIGEFDFVEQAAQALRRRERFAGDRVGDRCGKAVDANLHEDVVSLLRSLDARRRERSQTEFRAKSRGLNPRGSQDNWPPVQETSRFSGET